MCNETRIGWVEGLGGCWLEFSLRLLGCRIPAKGAYLHFRQQWIGGCSGSSSQCRFRCARVGSTSAVVARLRLEMVDFRSDRMESPEGRGVARRAWEAY